MYQNPDTIKINSCILSNQSLTVNAYKETILLVVYVSCLVTMACKQLSYPY
jgi:hypothetical protein